MSSSQTNFRANDMLGVPKPKPVAKPAVAKPAHSKPTKEAKKEVVVEVAAPVEVVEPITAPVEIVAEPVETTPVED